MRQPISAIQAVGAGAILLAFLLGLYAAAPPPRRPPANLKFQARPGDVVFPHARHIQWAKGDCSVCHPKLFPSDAKAPLHWKEGMHKPAEANGTSCGACHREGGAAFETKGNCRRCHGPEPDISGIARNATWAASGASASHWGAAQVLRALHWGRPQRDLGSVRSFRLSLGTPPKSCGLFTGTARTVTWAASGASTSHWGAAQVLRTDDRYTETERPCFTPKRSASVSTRSAPTKSERSLPLWVWLSGMLP